MTQYIDPLAISFQEAVDALPPTLRARVDPLLSCRPRSGEWELRDAAGRLLVATAEPSITAELTPIKVSVPLDEVNAALARLGGGRPVDLSDAALSLSHRGDGEYDLCLSWPDGTEVAVPFGERASGIIENFVESLMPGAQPIH